MASLIGEVRDISRSCWAFVALILLPLVSYRSQSEIAPGRFIKSSKQSKSSQVLPKFQYIIDRKVNPSN